MSSITARADYLLKHNLLLNKIFRIILSSILKCFGLFIPVDDKAIIFSAHGRKYNDSPKALYEYMISNSQFEGYKYYWAIDNPEETNIPGSCVKIRSDTFQYFKTALKCKYWITCVNIERGLNFKKRGTVYLNTNHGIAIKTCGNAASGRSGQYDFSEVNYFCISGDYEKKVYLHAYNLKPESLAPTGMPRNDTLFHTTEDEIDLIKSRLGIPNKKKLILYAPTWRDSQDHGKTYCLQPPIQFDLWKEMLDEKYILLLRFHPYTNKLLGLEFNDFVRDYSGYDEINDLLKISSILISDYSATIFDYAILERPIICFGYDYNQYKEERGFSLRLEDEIPGGILSNEIDVLEKIKTMDFAKECELTKRFKQKYIQYGGDATEKCIKLLFG